MPDEYQYDVFLSHSTKDKAVVRPLAERLRDDGVTVWFDEWAIKPGDSIPAKIEKGLECSRVLVLCMSANAFGSDWAQLESGTFRFRDPLNKDRRFLPLRLDDCPIKGSLAQFLCVNWRVGEQESEYLKLREFCRPQAQTQKVKEYRRSKITADRAIQLRTKGYITSYAFSSDGTFVVTGDSETLVKVWDIATGRRLHTFNGHTKIVRSVALSLDEQFILSGSDDGSLRYWDLHTNRIDRVNEYYKKTGINSAVIGDSSGFAISGGTDGIIRIWEKEKWSCDEVPNSQYPIWSIVLSGDGKFLVIGSADGAIRVRLLSTGRCLHILEGHIDDVNAVAISPNERWIASGGWDQSVRVWDTSTWDCVRVFKGHTADVTSVAWTADSKQIISGSSDTTARCWNIEEDSCVGVLEGHASEVRTLVWNDGLKRVISGDEKGEIRIWNLPAIVSQERKAIPSISSASHDQIQYTNAKVIVVGDTHSGKTGLTHRLAGGDWKPSEDSTVGAWATQWKLNHNHSEDGVDREIWLWDFGGQADQRIIHQLYIDHTALILLLFNADQEDVLPGLRDWQTALHRGENDRIPCFLVAGRVDTGFKASRGKLENFAREQGLAYHETSAKSGEGCEELKAAIINGIPWAQVERRTSPRIFKLIKDEILKLRDQGQVLHTFKELRELLRQRLPEDPHFTDGTLQTVIGLLDGPGVVKELEYGTYILLAPEWINVYAQAVIRTIRSAENDLGVLPLRSIAEGKLLYQSIGRDGIPVEMRRLQPTEERVVLGEMERQLEQRRLCLRQGDKLVFPSHCGRDRPAVMKHPSVFVSYAVKGFLDEIYATLVVKLADSESFQLKELWRDAADFVTLEGDHHMGLKLTRDSGIDGEISVYFGQGVTQQEQVIFANYIDTHLQTACELAQRLRHYVCPKCYAPKGNAEVLKKRLLRDKQTADTECDNCGERFPLWDALEKKFASDVVRRQVQELRADDLAKLSTRRKGRLLVLDVGARITSANQKWIEVPGDEDDGIDMMVEFTDEDGNGNGKGLCLQLKAGNSHLKKRKSDGVEVFVIKKSRWVNTWMSQPHPVMLVIGTFSEADDRAVGKEKLEFADVRWMEISSYLKRVSHNGTRPVKQIEFKGERLDLSSVRSWRDRVVGSKPS